MILSLISQLSNELNALNEELVNLRLSSVDDNAKMNLLIVEGDQRREKIEILQNRITEMTCEASGNARKLCELQGLRLLKDCMIDLNLLAKDDLKSIEYEDLCATLKEKLSHIDCSDKISSLVFLYLYIIIPVLELVLIECTNLFTK